MREPFRRSVCRVTTLRYLSVTVSLLVGTAPGRAQSTIPAVTAGGDVMHGWRVFHEKKCVECHAIWGQGGHVGPDLGRIRVGRLSDGQLAGVMWNHIPKMLGRMRETGLPPTKLSSQEMDDLFALIFFVRQLDELGDPVRGEGILRAKGCSECHETSAAGVSIGPDLAKWSKYANPIVWGQLMWEHAPMMEEAMTRAGMTWPKLEGTDLVHIVAYVRTTGMSGEKQYLSPGSVERGEKLFSEKGCDTCHPETAPDLATAELPTSAGALASRMWNHSPSMMQAMRQQEVDKTPLTPQDLADIIGFVLALGHSSRGGDGDRGARIFAEKGCVQCHESGQISESGSPSVVQLGADATPVKMATAMWNHGETMLERMTEAGMSWPVFNDTEMVDLLAFLSTAQAAVPTEHKVGE